MEKRILGRTGFEVSIIGLGGIPIQQCSQEDATKLIKAAYDNGINFIDTARAYTVSEDYIGRALKDLGIDDMYIATKTAARTYEGAKKDFEISYRDLAVDCIDLYQFHNLSTMEDYYIVMGDDGAYKFFEEMKEKGLIKEIGITSHSADVMDIALDSDYFSTMQFPYNVVESQGVPLLEKAHKKNIGTIAMKPIAGGVLMNHGEEAIRYILENENLTLAIPGMSTIDEVKRNSEIGKNFKPLEEREKEELIEVAKSLGNDFCRRCNYCQPCTVGINISNMFTIDLYNTKYGLHDWAQGRYDSSDVKPDECIECGDCEARCPYDLPIIEKLKGVRSRFENV